MSKNQKILIAILSLLVIGVIAFFVFSSQKSEDLSYSIESLSGQINTRTTSTGEVVSSGTIETGKRNIQIVAYISDTQGTVQKTDAGGKIIDIKTGEVIAKNDSISTGKNSSVSLVFIDNSIVRLSENSRLTITKKAGKSVEVSLDTGDMWARVLKPLYDSSFFTVKAADVSAGVQGTSIRIKRTADILTITVIDSYSQDPNRTGASITGSGITAHLPVEHSIEINLAKGNHTEKTEEKKKLLSDNFVRENTKRDLVYMDSLRQAAQDTRLQERLDGELKVTMPSPDETVIFFDEAKLRDLAGKALIDSRHPLASSAVLEMIKKDLVIQTIREQTIAQTGLV